MHLLKCRGLAFGKFTFAFVWNLFSCSVRIVLSEMKCFCFVLPMQMPFILPLNYTKCSVGRADVHQLQKNKSTEKEKKSRGRAGHFSCQVPLVWDNLLHFVSVKANRGSQLVPCPGLLPGHQWGHQPTKVPPLQAQRSTGAQWQAENYRYKGRDNKSRTVLGKPLSQSPDMKPIKMSQCQSTFWRYLDMCVMCQQLGALGSSGYWADSVSPAAERICIARVCVYKYTHMCMIRTCVCI